MRFHVRYSWLLQKGVIVSFVQIDTLGLEKLFVFNALRIHHFFKAVLSVQIDTLCMARLGLHQLLLYWFSFSDAAELNG